jgi:hypothetical protein
MSEKVAVFLLEPTDREKRWLRRYGDGCTAQAPNRGYCNGMYELGDEDIRYTAEGFIDGDSNRDRRPPKTDPRWPVACEHCRKPFAEGGSWQLFTKQIYVRPDTGQLYTLDKAPPGAVWDAWWVHHRNRRIGRGDTGAGGDRRARLPVTPGVGTTIGPDGRCLVVRLPDGHDWMIDGRASNCTLKEDNTHHCWVRTGKPEDGTLHVSKDGNTCAAGAGSIVTDKWHGFLHHGHLVSC